MARISLALTSATCLVACGASLAETPRRPHPLSSQVQSALVDSSPPEANIEEVDAAPNDDCEWSDGYWKWDTGEWRWTSGQWVRNHGCYRADLTTVWINSVGSEGSLFAMPTAWYELGTDMLCPPPPACDGA